MISFSSVFCFFYIVFCYACRSLNWQHHLCNNPRQNPDIKTLFWDHSCGPGACATSPAINPLMGSNPKVGGFLPIGAHGVSL